MQVVHLEPLVDRFVAEFVGLSNIVPVEVVESSTDGAAVRVFGQTLRSRRPPRNLNNGVSVVLRPEALRINKAGGQGVPGRVLALAFTGPIARYTVAVNDSTELTVDLHNPDPDEFFAEGTASSLQLPTEVPALLG